MAMNEIQVGRLSAILHKLLQMKEGAPSPTLATDVFPNLVLENDRPEWAFLAGTRLCVGSALNVTPAAGEYAGFIIGQPANSGAIVVVQEIILSTATAAYTLIDQADGVVTTVGANAAIQTRDGRYALGTLPTARVSHFSAAALPSTVAAVRRGTNNSLTWPFVLYGARRLVVYCGTADQEASCTFLWYERPIESSETR